MLYPLLLPVLPARMLQLAGRFVQVLIVVVGTVFSSALYFPFCVQTFFQLVFGLGIIAGYLFGLAAYPQRIFFEFLVVIYLTLILTVDAIGELLQFLCFGHNLICCEKIDLIRL
jgi:hypothetical protein